jgi:hypothetical protein
VSKQLEPVYLASCPFCEYRQLFSSPLTMSIIYCAHLLDHEKEAAQGRQHGGKAVAQRVEGIARHFRRLNTAQYN